MAHSKLPAAAAYSTTSTSSLSSVLTDTPANVETEPTSAEPDPRPNPFEKIESWAPVAEEQSTSEDDGSIDWQLPNKTPRLKFKPEMSDFIYPKSCYIGFQPPLPISQEDSAVEDLLREMSRLGAEGNRDLKSVTSLLGGAPYIEFDLTQFSIYSPDKAVKKKHPLKLNGLQHLHTKLGISVFLFDGILSVGNVRRYVQGVPFEEVPVGNYGRDRHSVGGEIWIRSKHNSNFETYYRLKEPSSEYLRFHKGFLWLADLAKHFVDFCRFCEPGTVTLARFREEFSQWVLDQHEESQEFHEWWHEYNYHDFRQAVAANAPFLYKECCGIDENDDGVRSLQKEPIWDEVLHMDVVPKQRIVEQKTIVTPYVFQVFSDLNFGSHLKSVDFSGSSKDKQLSRVESLHLTEGAQAEEPAVVIPQKMRPVRVGDVISINKDGTDSAWKDEVSRHRAAKKCWYGYVVAVHEDEDGEPEFDVIWLYHPSETPCAKMWYPWSNEYFMSNHCTCKEKHAQISLQSVLGIQPVLWHSSPPTKQIFIRQTVLNQERFVTLKESHKVCEHHRKATPEYPIGQTVFAPPLSQKKHGLEVYEVVEYVPDGKVMLRRFLRRRDFDGTGRPNELVYSDKFEKHNISAISGKCLVRFYTENDAVQSNIPAPYCRDGNGNAFYISTRLVDSDGDRTLVPIHKNLPRKLIQGFDPSADLSRPLLRGMDLYCGGGNFGRGIEEGGAVRNEWAVDIYDAAIHTYRANLKESHKTKMFFGSVNDLLYQAMQGNPTNSDLIPAPGEVDFIAAGSPCQGFSLMNTSRNNAKGLKNQSLVASVAAYVDFYRPKYGLLENVMNMAQSGLRRDEDVLSQLVCAIVGMGYQVELFVLDAWSCGSPQNRTRIFVSFAAPGLVPLQHPHLSHSHPEDKKARGLGKLANGQAFGLRKNMPTPFSWVSIGEATKHLPPIGDAHTNQCTSYPYHVLAPSISEDLKQQIDCIPTKPRGMNFSKAWKEGKGIMSKEERALFPNIKTDKGKLREAVRPTSRAWGRVHPGQLIPTIVVSTSAADSRMGLCLHWDEPRYITVAEAQIAQGFLDSEVLVGNNKDWWKLLGNSVCRNVALALGLSLREAWLASDDSLPHPVKKSVVQPSFDLDQARVLQNPRPSQKRKAILPPPREKEPKIPRLGGYSSASFPSLAQNPADNDAECLGVIARDLMNSNEMQSHLAKAQERLASSQNMGNNAANCPQPPHNSSIPLPKRPVPASNPSPRPHAAKKYKATVDLHVEVIDLVMDSEEGNAKAEKPNGKAVPKYQPVDNSAFGAYGQTRGVLDLERATAAAAARKRKM